MFERLALLADRQGRWVVITAVVLSIAAGAIGSGVADRLDPYGADDPATESVEAADRLEQSGYRESGVVVLVDVDVDSAAGRDRIEALTETLRADNDVARWRAFTPPARATSSRATAVRPTCRPTVADGRR